MQRGFGLHDVPFHHLCIQLRIVLDKFLVLAMRGNQAGRLLEYGFQNLILIDKHIARATAHKNLDATHFLRIGFHDFRKVVISRAEIERIVCQRLFGGKVKLLLQKLLRSGLRVGVGHVHKRGHATGHGCMAFGVDVPLVVQARLAEMHMLIDDTRNEVFACSVNLMRQFHVKTCNLVRRGVVPFPNNLGNLAVRNKNTCHEGLAFVDKCRIFNKIVHFLGFIFPVKPLQRRLMTPKTASLKMPLLIFD